MGWLLVAYSQIFKNEFNQLMIGEMPIWLELMLQLKLRAAWCAIMEL